MSKTLFANILAGTRAALFMPVQLWMFRGGFAQVCLLFLVSLALTVLHDYVDTYPEHVFNPYAISHQGLLYFLFFFSLVLVARINQRLADVDKLIVLFLSIVPVIWLGTLSLYMLVNQLPWLTAYQSSWLVFILYSIWYLLASLRLFKRFFYLAIMPATALSIVYLAINLTPLFVLPSSQFWHEIDRSLVSEQAQQNIDIEAVYYAQPALLERAQQGVTSGDSDNLDLFFIGFAGYADEDVFMNEVLRAEQIVEQRYASYGRSALMINNMATLANYPLANRLNLESMLSSTAGKMDEEDILFLFITSHGSEEHDISTEFNPLQLSDIDPASLKQLLAKSGIAWRIIVISACFSGGFIDHLADEKTLLITASRHDRHSFGCGHDGDYTYFGEAFFESGLKQGLDLQSAFEQAKTIIREKETGQGFDHSEPQLIMGEEMAEKLLLLEANAEKRKQRNWAMTK